MEIQPETKDSIFTIDGDEDEVISAIEQVSWIFSVLQKPIRNSVTCFYVSFQGLSSTVQIDIIPITKYKKSLPQSPCWLKLFNHTAVIAAGFPIPKRTDGKGLEIPFQLMV